MLRRYPGVSPFTSEQKNIFFGRDNDIKKLKKLISLRKQVLLYSKSGIGKSSLLNAGIFPIFQKKYTIIRVRFFAYNDENSESPLEKMVNAIKTQTHYVSTKTVLSELLEKTDYRKTLWYYFKQLKLTERKEEKYILVFDQFEELFSYPEEQIDEFKEQFYELTKIDIPDSIMQFIASTESDSEEMDLLYEDVKIKTIFAVRSDRLSLLNQLTDKLPDIQEIFYELKSFTNLQAKEAIINPARDTSNKFESPVFEFEEQAVENIINALSENGKENIETTQLQIVCRRIEEDVQKKKLAATNNLTDIKVTAADIPDFKDIFFDFYESATKETKQQEKTQKFIEDQLIRNDQRISLDEIICHDYVTKETLKILTNTHLLRAEGNSTGGFSYELSHDTLIEPILISRKKRIKKEEELQAEKEREQELLLAKQEAEKVHLEHEKEHARQRQIITIVSVAAIASVMLAFFGFWQMRKATQNLKQAINYEVIGMKKDATLLKNGEVYQIAIDKYKELLEIYKQYPQYNYDTTAVYKEIGQCYLLDSISKNFRVYMSAADSLIEKKDINNVIKSYAYYTRSKNLNYPNANKTFEKYNIKFNQATDNLKMQAIASIEAGSVGYDIAFQILSFLRQVKPEDKEIEQLYNQLKP